MVDRLIRRIGRDDDGNVVRLCNDGEYWSPRAEYEVINDIETNFHTYYLHSSNGRVEIKVVEGPNGKFLTTGPEGPSLSELPDC